MDNEVTAIVTTTIRIANASEISPLRHRIQIHRSALKKKQKQKWKWGTSQSIVCCLHILFFSLLVNGETFQSDRFSGATAKPMAMITLIHICFGFWDRMETRSTRLFWLWPSKVEKKVSHDLIHSFILFFVLLVSLRPMLDCVGNSP